MIRYYGSDYKEYLNSQFLCFRDPEYVKPSAYSTRISDMVVDSRFWGLRDNARDAALSANSHMSSIQGVGLSAINDITPFYDMVDGVSTSIMTDASALSEILSGILETINGLCTLLHSAKSGYSFVTVEAINNACKPLKTAQNHSVGDAIVHLYNPDGTVNSENEEKFREALEGLGLVDVSDEDMRGLYLVYLYLRSQGYTDDEIFELLPAIYNSNNFDQVNVLDANSPSNIGDCIDGILEGLNRIENIDAYNYMIVVDNLVDENGNFNAVTLESYRNMLLEMGIMNVTDDDIRGYLAVVEELRSRGFTDEMIAAHTYEIYTSGDLGAFADDPQQIDEYADSLSVDLRRHAAAAWAEYAANDDGYYYVWGGWGPGQTSPDLGEPGGYDCGHFVTTAMFKAGIFTEEDQADFPSSTDYMEGYYTQHGFESFSYSNTEEYGELQPGDVLLRNGHAAIYIGNGQIAHASTRHAPTADQVLVADNPGDWDTVLRYNG